MKKLKMMKNHQFKIQQFKIIYKASSGECTIFRILLELLKNNKSLLYFNGEYVLPVKFKNNLRADFFCLIIDKENKIKKVVIEIHGDQHYKFIPFFNNIHTNQRDIIKKEYCLKNNIIFLEVSYNKINMFQKQFCDILKNNS